MENRYSSGDDGGSGDSDSDGSGNGDVKMAFDTKCLFVFCVDKNRFESDM